MLLVTYIGLQKKSTMFIFVNLWVTETVVYLILNYIAMHFKQLLSQMVYSSFYSNSEKISSWIKLLLNWSYIINNKLRKQFRILCLQWTMVLLKCYRTKFSLSGIYNKIITVTMNRQKRMFKVTFYLYR